MGKKRRRRAHEPSESQVNASIADIGRCASKCAQDDYKGTLEQPELRLLTTVYVQRLYNLLLDPEVEWHMDLDGELCQKD